MSLQPEFLGKKDRIRPDGVSKVTGGLQYLTDLSFPNMLYGKVLRSQYPHANIVSICTDHAKKLPGVRAVITYKDIPGLNGFGIIIPNQPVFCVDKVRFIGDAVAAVAADTEEIAEQALSLIEVVYKPLEVIDCPQKALSPNAEKLHLDGNILHQSEYKKGDIEEGFKKCSIIIEETYELPRQMHTYMETEGGIVLPEENGHITVYMGTQHGYKDRFQLSRILAMPEEHIRVVSSPMGGSFGGKDELNVQPYGALLALATGRPVKIHQSRRESVRTGIKRHPMKVTMKTGVDECGNILAHQVRIVADTGAYATLGPAVLDCTVEQASGPYLIPNVDIEGLSVYTNNGVAGEFRGFGANQMVFALEGQIERLAERLHIDALDLRRRNIRKADSLGPLGQRIAPTNGALEILEAISCTPRTTKTRKESLTKWKVTGSGTAISMLGVGLGFGILDPGGGRLSLSNDGKIEAAFGFEEIGQGVVSVIENILLEEFKCSPEDIRILIGDTALVPPAGSSTASRATTMVWKAIKKMKSPFQQKIMEKAVKVTGIAADQLQFGTGGIWDKSSSLLCITYAELAQHISNESSNTVHTDFHFPTTPDDARGHYLYTFGAVSVQVEIDCLTGKIRISQLKQTVAAGPIISPMGYLGQIEGGSVMALGYTLLENALMDKGEYVTANLDSYLIPTICDAYFPIEVQAIEELCEGDSHGPRGVGEIGTIAVAPAIAAAIHEATGHWIRTLPISPEEILQAVTLKEMKEWL
ncbi:xanthine dehydrogenase subunit D [Bacillus sp. 165]|uniref:xanthine dehydrogenase subunit D n=1 Tax=Bacillus sp. 165 TaxID=1529117 RepID=UPI001ADBB7BD|nr:xanthine dehydrogenase subunit D [Bacillus sp. 165]MBO9131036.1 xanthine dehydrogenase subunit D [Bacillus sp. 165]